MPPVARSQSCTASRYVAPPVTHELVNLVTNVIIGLPPEVIQTAVELHAKLDMELTRS